MAKNRKAVKAFLETYRPADETHEKAISYFCILKRLAIQVNREGEHRIPITYEQFKAWFEGDAPEQGDIVFFPDNGMIGIISLVGIDTVNLYVSLRGDELKTQEHAVPIGNYREASKEEMLALQRALNKAGLAWNHKFHKIVERKVPLTNKRIQISVLGRKFGYGVFREINTEGMIVMYILKRPGRVVRYSLHEVVGPVDDYQLEQINVSQSNEFINDMKQEGKVWNGFLQRVEPASFRADVGEQYWYITEGWEVQSTIDHNKLKDQNRFKGGNYFRDESQARMMRDQMVKDRKRQLAKKNKEA